MAEQLQRALDIARLALAFGEVDRATAHPDGRPETDTTHTVMLALLAGELAELEVENLWTFNPRDVVALALVHDLVETFAGDTCTARGLTPEQAQVKEVREAAARQRIRELLGESSWVVRILDRYEAQETHEARFVRYLDKITPKLTHVLNGGRALRAIGMTFTEMRAKHEEQSAALAQQYPEFKATRALFDEACRLAEERCEVPRG